MDYQEKLLELAKENGISALKGERFEVICEDIFQKLLNENKKIKEENSDYEQSNIGLGNLRISLEEKLLKYEDDINDLRNENNCLKYKLSEQSKCKIAESEDSKEKKYNKAMSDNQDFKQIIKSLASLL